MTIKEVIRDIALIVVCLVILSGIMILFMRSVHCYEWKKVKAEQERYDAFKDVGILIAPHEWNLVIEYNQTTRKTWIGRLIVPAKWDEMKPIQ